MMTIGACGLMNAVGNLKPRVLAQMCEAVFAGDLATGRAPARAAARDQQGRVLRHEPDSDEVHDEEARPARGQRAPPADGAARRRSSRRKLDGVLERAGLLALNAMRAAELRSRRLRRASAPSADDGVVDVGRLLGEQHPTLGAVLRSGELHRAHARSARRASRRSRSTRSAICRRCPIPRRSSASASTTATATPSTRTAPRRRSIRACSCARRAASSGTSSRSANPPESRAARLRRRDRARDRQSGPAHRGRGCAGSTSRGSR